VLFDQGIGDVFVARLAGNIVDDAAMGSLEYGSAVLGSRLIVVLGHDACGAVKATVKGDKVPGKIGVVVKAIKPSAKAAAKLPGNVVDHAIEINVREQVAKLKSKSSVLRPLVEKGTLQIIGGVYHLESGRVTFLK
jgi:carbonic anhydrase